MISSRRPLHAEGYSDALVSFNTVSLSRTPLVLDSTTSRTQLHPPARPWFELQSKLMCLCRVLPPTHGAMVDLACSLPEIVCRRSCTGWPCAEMRSLFSSILPA